jgi:hypothetical protein
MEGIDLWLSVVVEEGEELGDGACQLGELRAGLMLNQLASMGVQGVAGSVDVV